MKKHLFKAKYLVLVAVALTAVSCDDDDNGNEIDNSNTIYDIVDDNADFSILEDALELTGLDDTLDSNGSFTVFAPTDTAFNAFFTANNIPSVNDVPVATLRNILLNHVVAGEVTSGMLTDGYVKTQATNTSGENLDLYVDLTTGVVLNGGATVTTPDIAADNGVVHIVNEVIGLPTIATLAAANPSFSNLVTALAQEELVSVVADLNANLTVFAPLNTSFDALVQEDPLNAGWTSVADVLALGDGNSSSTSTLDGVLTYHVLNTGDVRAADITDGVMPTTVQGTTFTINTTSGVVITDGNSRAINVIVTDVTAINGVVHAIDNVLLP